MKYNITIYGKDGGKIINPTMKDLRDAMRRVAVQYSLVSHAAMADNNGYAVMDIHRCVNGSTCHAVVTSIIRALGKRVCVGTC